MCCALLGLLALMQAAAAQSPPVITAPNGLTVEEVASPPLVEHPMLACFDERGRLFVADSAGVNLSAEELLKNPPHSIRMLEDTDGDDRFDKSTVFADRMVFPEGVLWHDGALYTASPPYLWRLEDTDGDGKADKRQPLVGKFRFTGNAADIHGPFLGPEGRIYWTTGHNGHAIPDLGSVLKGRAARVYRCRPDGSDIEVLCGGGMVNLTEVAFTPEGEAMTTVTHFLHLPRRIDAIIHGVEGGVFPFDENVLAEFKMTGDLLPSVTLDLGSAAPSGLMRYRSTALGLEYENSFFSAQFNTHKIQRHILQRVGATFRSRDEDFLVSGDFDFHPTDVIEDADGSLLVIDTGAWFTKACPVTRTKAEGRGAIYRVRLRDTPRISDPRGLTLNWTGLSARCLVQLLDDPRFAVRDRAVEVLARLETNAVPALEEALQNGTSVRIRQNALWTLARIENGAARAAIRSALSDDQASVRQVAAYVAGLYRDAEALKKLEEILRTDESQVRREAATALGRVGDKMSVPTLLAVPHTGGDAFLEHALVYALIRIADPDETAKALRDKSGTMRRRALIALDQMEGGNLTLADVKPLLDPSDASLKQAALAVIARRPGWANEITQQVRNSLELGSLETQQCEDVQRFVLSFCREESVQDLVAEVLRNAKTPVATRLLLLETMARASLERLPPTWAAEARWGLQNRDERVVSASIAVLKRWDVVGFDQMLLCLARQKERPPELRVECLVLAAPNVVWLETDLFEFLVGLVGPENPPLLRLRAAEALGRAWLSSADLLALNSIVAAAGPLELPHLVRAYKRVTNITVTVGLLDALDRSPGLDSLTGEALRELLEAYPAEVKQEGEKILKRLEGDIESRKQHLMELEPVLLGGDAELGREVFFGSKVACGVCHTVGSQGSQVGPDLSKIGGIRGGKEILEAVVFPSASIVRGYETYIVETHDGLIYDGILARETSEAIYLYTADRVQKPIARTRIMQISQGRVSVMPQGLDAALSRQELADLMAFLQSLK